MATVIIRADDSVDAAIRRFKKKCINEGILENMRSKEEYVKPSVKKKLKNKKAAARRIKEGR